MILKKIVSRFMRAYVAIVVVGFVGAGAVALSPELAVAQFSPTYELIDGLKKNDLYAIKTNVLRGANVNARNEDGVPVIVLAAGMGQPGVVRFLIEQGAHVNVSGRQDRETALLRAVDRGDQTTVAVLLYFGGDPNMGNDIGETPLIRAVSRGNLKIVELLLESGADPELADNTGLTAIDYAGRSRSPEILNALESVESEG